MKIISTLLIAFFLVGCAFKQPKRTVASTIIIKTPNLKFYDKGFINYYDNYIHLQLLSIGNVVLDLSIFKDKICKSSLQCVDAKSFNSQYLVDSYDKDFLFNLFYKKKIYFKDKKNNILIKVK